jgi:hypothetical protein
VSLFDRALDDGANATVASIMLCASRVLTDYMCRQYLLVPLFSSREALRVGYLLSKLQIPGW